MNEHQFLCSALAIAVLVIATLATEGAGMTPEDALAVGFCCGILSWPVFYALSIED